LGGRESFRAFQARLETTRRGLVVACDVVDAFAEAEVKKRRGDRFGEADSTILRRSNIEVKFLCDLDIMVASIKMKMMLPLTYCS
jgi:hypothetical protein